MVMTHKLSIITLRLEKVANLLLCLCHLIGQKVSGVIEHSVIKVSKTWWGTDAISNNDDYTTKSQCASSSISMFSPVGKGHPPPTPAVKTLPLFALKSRRSGAALWNKIYTPATEGHRTAPTRAWNLCCSLLYSRNATPLNKTETRETWYSSSPDGIKEPLSLLPPRPPGLAGVLPISLSCSLSRKQRQHRRVPPPHLHYVRFGPRFQSDGDPLLMLLLLLWLSCWKPFLGEPDSGMELR